jgi:type VI protein secretion system component Hcp
MANDLPDVYLRFGDDDQQDLPGESFDAAYPKSEGWTVIKSFSFGIGWSESDSGGKGADAAKKLASGKKLSEAEQKDLADHIAKGGGGAKPGKDAAAEGTLKPHDFTFSRSPGIASKPLIEALRAGKDFDKVELIVCRAAGVDAIKEAEARQDQSRYKEAKIPFCRLLLETVRLTKVSLSVGKDSPPAENVEFKFQKVTMETIWTKNFSGEKVPGSTLRVMYDFNTGSGKAEDEKGDWSVEVT